MHPDSGPDCLWYVGFLTDLKSYEYIATEEQKDSTLIHVIATCAQGMTYVTCASIYTCITHDICA